MPEPISPRKSLGQNFLRDPNTARKIIAALEAPPDAPVVEIGPGMGALTGLLYDQYPGLIALEVDERAVLYLKERYPALDVRHADVLAVDWQQLAAECGHPLYVIGNLPYYITSQILFSLLDATPHVRRAVVMMQLEVAERLVAMPGSKAYGILSVQVQLYSRPELLFRVSRNVFFPKPDVTSAVVRLNFHGADERPAVDREALRQVVRAAFNQRRKTLRNSLRSLTGAAALPAEWGDRRADALAPEEFVALTRYIQATKQA